MTSSATSVSIPTNLLADILARLERLEGARPVLALPKLEKTLIQALEAAHASLPEPHFISTKTGNPATSLFALQDAMSFAVPSGRWADMVKRLQKLPSYYGRKDLEKRSGWPTPCFDLADVEQALLLMWPGRKKDRSDSKGKAIFDKFKKKWGVE